MLHPPYAGLLAVYTVWEKARFADSVSWDIIVVCIPSPCSGAQSISSSIAPGVYRHHHHHGQHRARSLFRAWRGPQRFAARNPPEQERRKALPKEIFRYGELVKFGGNDEPSIPVTAICKRVATLEALGLLRALCLSIPSLV